MIFNTIKTFIRKVFNIAIKLLDTHLSLDLSLLDVPKEEVTIKRPTMKKIYEHSVVVFETTGDVWVWEHFVAYCICVKR